MKSQVLVSAVLLSLFSLHANAFETGQGASFNEVLHVISDNNPNVADAFAANELLVYRAGKLPFYEPILDPQIALDAKRTLTDDADYYPRLEKHIHANGICFTGTWKVTRFNSPYTGYFAAGKEALFIGRASVTTDKTLAGQPRTFGFAGKLFPTLDPNKAVKTANFFTVDYLFGSRVAHFTDTALTNDPKLFSSFTETDWEFIGSAIRLGKIFGKVNKQPTFRPVTNIASLGTVGQEPVRAPKYIEVSAFDSVPRIDAQDFRDELNLKKYPAGITLRVAAGDEKDNLITTAEIHLERSFVSYGCDRQLHFAHPRVD